MNVVPQNAPGAGEMQSNRRALVIFNPAAGWRRGRRKRFNLTLRHLQQLGCKWEVRETDGTGHAWQMARDAAANAGLPGAYDTIVAAGGDGTINEVIRGIEGSALALGIIPLGTANVLAHEIGLGTDPGYVAEVIATAPVTPVCLGEVNGTPFAIMAGAGLDAHVCARANLTLKRWTGKFAYAWTTLIEILGAPDATYQVTIDGARHEAASVIVANGRSYAGRFVSAPGARLDDPKLHAVLYEQPGRWNRLRYVTGTLTGRHLAMDHVKIVAGNEIAIEGAASEPVQADGDVVAGLPVTCRIAATRLNLLRPVAAA